MVKVYIGELLPGVRPFPILNRHLRKEPYRGKKPYRAIFDEMDFSFIALEENPERADFLLIPHNYYSIKTNENYIGVFVELAEKHNKKIIVFAYGDSDDAIHIPHAIIFRYAGYRYRGLSPNEIIMPTQIYGGDILEEGLLFLRDKKEKPTVSFCGWAGFDSLRSYLAHKAKIFPHDVRKYLWGDKNAEVHKQGIYFRKKALHVLRSSSLIETSFIERNFYSANKNTIQGDPEELRKEYVENLLHSDCMLTVRGDANMAVRFYEALALGRIPVLIDTDWMLPLEDVIDYKKFVIFVPHTDIKNTDRYIKEFWDKLDTNEFQDVQKLARETFMKYLKFDSFLRHIFKHELKH